MSRVKSYFNIVNGARVDLRAALHVHGADFGHHPAHGLQRRVVVADVHAAAHEVLLLKDDHAAALVGLGGNGGVDESRSLKLDCPGDVGNRMQLTAQ